MRQIQFLEIVNRFKAVNNIEHIQNIDKKELLGLLDFCEQITSKVK